MKLHFVLFLGLFCAACSMPNSSSGGNSTPGKVYAKVDLDQLPACGIHQPCASATASCLSIAGSQPVCVENDETEDFVGCTKGKVIVFESYPGQAGCSP